MLFDEYIGKQFSAYLLEIHAVKLSPENPFTWASGWKSPIYCDNRLTLSYPEIRNFIKKNLSKGIKNKFPEVDCIAGVATAGIPHGMLVADFLNLPFIYVRSEAKKHGLSNQIEGKIDLTSKIVVVEDLISTGMSSLQAVNAIRNAGGNVIGLAGLFTYGFQQAEIAFQDAKCVFYTMTEYSQLIQIAIEEKRIAPEQESLLLTWRNNPSTWLQ